MTTPAQHVVIVGAGLAGLRTLEQLRSSGFQGRVTLIGDEPHPPYDRPPLSKQILHGTWEPHRAVLRDRRALDELGVTVRLGARAVALHGTSVLLEDGDTVAGDALVLATGAVARRLPGQPAGAVTFRGLEDALALRRAFDSARSLVVVGAGFIGAEVAWAARRRDIAVTVVESQQVPCARVLGTEVGGLAGRLFTEAGVDLRCGAVVRELKDGHTVELADGTVLSGDIVLVSVGAVPDLAWLNGALPLAQGGVACDDGGRVDGVPGVWAVGDAAAWWDPVRAEHRRREHWTSAVDQASAVACDLLGTPRPVATPPYVWSDQFGLKVQVLGDTDTADEVVELHGAGLGGTTVKGTVAGYFTEGALSAVVSFGAPALAMRYRPLIASRAARDAVLAQAGRPVPTATRRSDQEAMEGPSA
ncbi:FAD-dependent oxidoreductase [Streptomyces sp. NPDC052052]|uniref:NAD(P)/FAD-dependent oxidoreductase n=1 Tax=Streptomyces sp. NPDC052052 TaxID=3154756 RepID=UPI003438877A